MSQTKLAARAQRLSRQIFASLPFSYRFGVMMEVFSDTYAHIKDALGQTLYAVFYQAGVEGLPPIDEKKLKKLREHGPKAADILPKGIGGELARYVAGMARDMIDNEQDTMDFLQEFLEMVLKGKLKIDAEKAGGVRGAESYTKDFAKRRLIDRYRALKRERKRMPTQTMTERETGGQINIEDPHSLKAVIRRIDPRHRRKFQQELRKVDRKHPTWPEEIMLARMDGYGWREIGPKLGVPWGTISEWFHKNRDKIRDIFDRHIEIAEAV